ncbi:MAG: hypothetical protein QXQ36_02110 [Sulfolobales archaeon]
MVDLRKLKSDLMISFFISLFLLGIAPIFHLIGTIFAKGFTVIMRDPIGVFINIPPLPGTNDLGGIGPQLLGSLILVGLASIIGIPITILASAYSVEGMSRFLGPLTSLISKLMIEFPTIVVGLSVYGAILLLESFLNEFIRFIGWSSFIEIPKFSAISGVIALTIIIIPYTYAQIEEGFKSIPHSIREAVYSLGVSRIRAVMILSGYIKAFIVSGAMVGIAKIFGETAPLLFTAFGNDFYPRGFPDALVNPIGSLTLWIFKAALSPYDNWIDLAWAAATILILIVLLIFFISRYIMYRGWYR